MHWGRQYLCVLIYYQNYGYSLSESIYPLHPCVLIYYQNVKSGTHASYNTICCTLTSFPDVFTFRLWTAIRPSVILTYLYFESSEKLVTLIYFTPLYFGIPSKRIQNTWTSGLPFTPLYLAYYQNVKSSTFASHNTIYCTLTNFLDYVCLATPDGNSPVCCLLRNHSIQFIRIIASVITHLIVYIFKLNFFYSCIASAF